MILRVVAHCRYNDGNNATNNNIVALPPSSGGFLSGFARGTFIIFFIFYDRPAKIDSHARKQQHPYAVTRYGSCRIRFRLGPATPRDARRDGTLFRISSSAGLSFSVRAARQSRPLPRCTSTSKHARRLSAGAATAARQLLSLFYECRMPRHRGSTRTPSRSAPKKKTNRPTRFPCSTFSIEITNLQATTKTIPRATTVTSRLVVCPP